MMPRAASFRLLLLLGSALAGFTACQNAPATGRYAVSSMKAPFYKYGPAQAFGADFALVRGQHVTMVERGFGYSRVQTEDGVAGFIATDDIVPDPDSPKPQARVASRRGPGSRSGGGSSRKRPTAEFEPDAGLFNFDDVPLPTDPEPPKKAADQPPKSDSKPAPKP